jgi:hypothetical protein
MWMKNANSYSIPPPPPDPNVSLPMKGSRRKIYAAAAIAIVLVAVLIPVFLIFFGNGNAAANASSLEYKEIIRYPNPNDAGTMTDIYTVSVKNFDKPNTIMARYEGTANGEQILQITNEGTGKIWTYYQGQWSDTSFMYNATISMEGWTVFKNALKNWNGSGEVSFTYLGSNVTIYDIKVNPNLPDALFQR